MLEFREQIPVTKELIYLNHAAISPTPIFALMESLGYLYGVSIKGSLHVNQVEGDDFLNLRRVMGNFLNADPREISFIPNTSYGINMIVHGLNLSRGDVILTDNLEFPSTVYPLYKLAKRGVTVKMVKESPQNLEESILEELSDKVKLVVISHVSFNTGVRLDIGKIATRAKSNGSLLLVDAIQSAGALKIDVQETGVDFLVAGGYKWMMSPQGSGFMYVRKGLVQDPPFYGWKSSSTYMEFNPETFALEEGPRRFEIGTIDISATLALTKVAERLTPIRDDIERRVLQLSAQVIDEAEDMGLEVITPKERRAGIVVVRTRDPRKVAEKLLAKKIVVSPRGEGVRVSTHFYNTEEEVSKAVSEVKKSQS